MRPSVIYLYATILCWLPALAGGLPAATNSSLRLSVSNSLQQAEAQRRRERGAAYCRQRDWTKAIEELDGAIRLAPGDASAYCLRGGAYCVRGELDSAIDDFTRQIELSPTNASGYFNRGNAFRAKRDFANALADFTTCLRLSPADVLAYKSRAAAYEAMGEFQKAVRDWTEGLRLSPNDATALAARGHAYQAQGQFTKALDDYREAIRLGPTNDLAYNNLAWLRATCPRASMRSGREAVKAARKACELTDWSNWTRIDTLAAALAEAGEFQNAAKHQRQAMRMAGPDEPGHKEMERRLGLYEQGEPYRETRGYPSNSPASSPEQD